ncbi:tetratricopeptide repeat protein [Clostridium thermarum]|uniref:tetratricopeptide repeat protein n=1 Tax=Clostridium thermarum TaxID=1716543 RepID=UPI0013D2B210|nr:tetratricopeptide repeat protein [Clostridium thermarum]
MEFVTGDEAEVYCRKKLKSCINEEDIDDVIKISKLYVLEELTGEVYKRAGDINYFNHNYTKAFEYYQKALFASEKNGEKDRMPFLYNILGACKHAEMRYEEALSYYDKANIYAIVNNDRDIEIKSLYNCALCYRRMEWFDRALEYVDKCIKKTNLKTEPEKYLRFHTLKINCCIDMREFDKAVSISNHLLTELKEKDGIIAAYIYNNMGNLYLEKGDVDESIKYFIKSEQIRRIKEPSKLCRTIIHKSSAYIAKKLYYKAEENIKVGIELAFTYNDYEYVTRGYNYLIQVYQALDQHQKIEETYEKIIELLKDKKPEELKKIYLKISEYYIKQGKLDKADEYIKLSLEGN